MLHGGFQQPPHLVRATLRGFHHREVDQCGQISRVGLERVLVVRLGLIHLARPHGDHGERAVGGAVAWVELQRLLERLGGCIRLVLAEIGKAQQQIGVGALGVLIPELAGAFSAAS